MDEGSDEERALGSYPESYCRSVIRPTVSVALDVAHLTDQDVHHDVSRAILYLTLDERGGPPPTVMMSFFTKDGHRFLRVQSGSARDADDVGRPWQPAHLIDLLPTFMRSGGLTWIDFEVPSGEDVRMNYVVVFTFV
jgi:hypothetical protein